MTTYKSINHLKATLFNGNLTPTQGINERRSLEVDDRISRSNKIAAASIANEDKFKREYVEGVATSEMVHQKGKGYKSD